MVLNRNRDAGPFAEPVDNTAQEQLLRPLTKTGKPFYAFVSILLIFTLWFLYAWYLQLTQGLGVTDMRTPVGAAWGIYIVHFVFFIGIAHGGIAIAAAITLLNLKKYQPVARIGEVLTIISLMMAGLSIMIDMGRPDRIFNIVLFWPERVGWSSLTWDVTVIIIYFAMSATYLWLTMRKDLAAYSPRFPKLSLLYKPLLIGYRPSEDAKVKRLTWWLSIAIVFLIVMLSGGVVAWIFGLLPARPGWFSALAGPYFLTAAISSAIAMIMVISIILRRIYKWQAQMPVDIFRGLGSFLGVTTLFYIYMIFAEQLTARYAAPLPELLVSDKLLTGEFAPIFWPLVVLGFFAPSIMLLAQAIRPKFYNTSRTFIAALLIVVAFWIKRFLIVIPSLLRPIAPFPEGSYTPSWVEWSIIVGIFAAAILLLVLFLKLFPAMEMHEE